MGLALDRQRDDEFFPNVTFTNQRGIDLPPGTTAGILLTPGVEYRVTGDDRGMPPYVVFGRTAPLDDDPTGTSDDGPPPRLLADPLRLTVDADRLALEAWDASLTYEQDQKQSGRLGATCLTATDAPVLDVRARTDGVSVRLGRCGEEISWPPSFVQAQPVMGVIAGAHWLSVQRKGGFRARSSIAWSNALSTALLAGFVTVLLVVDFGRPTAAFVAGALFLTSFAVHPIICASLLRIVAIVAVALLPVSIILALVPPTRRLLRVLSISFAYGVLLLFPRTALIHSDTTEKPSLISDDIQTLGAAPDCLLTGYSTVNDKSVRLGMPGSWRALAETCGQCRGGVTKYGQDGRDDRSHCADRL